jgi:acetyl esterase/lipase
MSSPTHVEREQTLDVAVDPRLSRGVKAFLQMLNASGGPPLETLPPLEARAESDILRDEGEAYGRKLDEAGVKVTTVRYDGRIHDFGLLNGLAEEPAVRSLFAHAAAELQHYLQ